MSSPPTGSHAGSSPPSFFERDVSLALRTTLGVGGHAEYLAEARSIDEARETLAWANDHGLPVLVLGEGSNVLVADRGLRGVVLRIKAAGRDRQGVRVRVFAGHGWDALVAYTVDEGLAGLECLSGIPGLVGATPIQNVGAYGQEVSETIATVDVIDRASGELRTMSASECCFGYRNSVFKGPLRDRMLVVAVTFDLRSVGKPSMRYPELERHLQKSGLDAPTLLDVREAVIGLRRTKSMVIDPDDENRRSAGSFFMNPIVDAKTFEMARERTASRNVLKEGESMPSYATDDGRVKLSAAWLIERAGFAKGTSRGAVGISTRHSLAIVNRGDARASDVLTFVREIRDGVHEAFGICLVPEPELVGFTPEEIGDLIENPKLESPPASNQRTF